jgi:hypothetical protein
VGSEEANMCTKSQPEGSPIPFHPGDIIAKRAKGRVGTMQPMLTVTSWSLGSSFPWPRAHSGSTGEAGTSKTPISHH